MDLLKALIIVSEKAANVARLCRQNRHLFQLLIQKKSSGEANPRFVDDFKTLADVLIQEVVKNDIGNRFPALKASIRGEENNVFSNRLGETICVEIKPTVQETATLLKTVLNDDSEAARLLAAEVHREVDFDEVNARKEPSEEFDLDLDDLGIWIDPIDSTAEYINGIQETSSTGISISGLHCVTVLIGAFSKSSGAPVLGVVNQPFTSQHCSQWKGECFWGGPVETSVPPPSAPTRTICVSGSENQDIIARLSKKYSIVEASGAGYKILTVITGLADAYLLTKDTTFKWDTCGPQAILNGLGGGLAVYDEAVKNGLKSVEYYENNGNCNVGGIIAFGKMEVFDDIVACLT